MEKEKIAIIGGGNLGMAIAEGMVESNFIEKENIVITQRTKKQNTLPYNILTDNCKAVVDSKWIILCIKPFQIEDLAKEIVTSINPAKHIIISCITGIGLEQLESLFPKVPVIRAMPNTAVSIRQSMTCISTNDGNEVYVEFIKNLFDKVGKSILIDEKLMDAATVLGACGTAFAMRFMRANIQGGVEIGFSSTVASLIASQTALGAAQLLLEKNTHPEQEIDKVTTPKGCTIAGLNEMEHSGFSSALIKGIIQSYKKITSTT